MRIPLLCILLLHYCYFVFGQETVKRSNNINNSITEKFTVLKSDKKIREGIYSAVSNGVVIACGQYKSGKRVGEWQFFSRKGKLVQNYNYDTEKISIVDSGDLKQVKCFFAKSIRKADTITYAAKIGGFFYGLLPLMIEQPDLSRTIRAENPTVQDVMLTHIFTVNAQGAMTKHEVIVTMDGKDKLYEVNDKEFDNDLKKFYPATINHQAVESKITAVTHIGFYTSTSIH